MFYVFPITTLANTPEASKLKTILQLTRGKITQIQVHFPSGHLGLTHIGINRGLHQFYPTNPEATFSSSGEAIVFAEDYDLSTPPLQLEAYTWNLDDTYPHTITVRIKVEPLAEAKSLVDEVKALLGIGGSQEAPGG